MGEKMKRQLLVGSILSLVVFMCCATLHADVMTFSGTSQIEDNTLMIPQGGYDHSWFNMGADTALAVGQAVGTPFFSNSHSLIRVNGLDALAGMTITQAKLRLTQYQAGAYQAADTTVEVYAVSQANGDWVEGNTAWNWPAGGESCWNRKAFDAIPWAGAVGCSLAGVDYQAALLGSVVAPYQNNGILEVTLPVSVVQQWVDNFAAGTKNYGLFLKTTDDGVTAGNFCYFYSSESGAGPELYVEYVPEPCSLSLLSIGGVLALVKRRR